MREIITYKGETAFLYVPLSLASASKSHPTTVFVATPSISTFQTKYYSLDSPPTKEEPISQEELEEIEWDNILRKPHVRPGLRRMAAEARRQIAAGETEEGGFAVE